jgi:hypothetical protein
MFLPQIDLRSAADPSDIESRRKMGTAAQGGLVPCPSKDGARDRGLAQSSFVIMLASRRPAMALGFRT